MFTPAQTREILNARRKELLEASDSAAAARQIVELDQQSVGRLSRQDALQQQAMANAQERLRMRDLQRIDAALQRLAEGDYGYCMSCGEEIGDRRLAIDPMAELCIACKK